MTSAQPIDFAPAISVILPVHNGDRTLRDALQSITAQSFANFELLIIDDGSTDQSGTIADAAALADGRVRVFHRRQEGLVASLNFGISVARGEYIARMDCDDISNPARFEQQYQYLQAHPEIAVLGTAFHEMRDDGSITGTTVMPCGSKAIAEHLRSSGNALCHPSTMIRSAALREIGGYRAAFKHCEDYELWLRLSERFPLENLAVPLLTYRRHSAAVSIQHLEQQVIATLAAQRCAELRATGQADPSRDATELTLETALHWGVTQRAIAQMMFARISDTERQLSADPSQSAWLSALRQKYTLGGTQFRVTDRFSALTLPNNAGISFSVIIVITAEDSLERIRRSMISASRSALVHEILLACSNDGRDFSSLTDEFSKIARTLPMVSSDTPERLCAQVTSKAAVCMWAGEVLVYQTLERCVLDGSITNSSILIGTRGEQSVRFDQVRGGLTSAHTNVGPTA